MKSYQATRTAPAPDSAVVRGPGEVEVRLRVNGEVRRMFVEPRVSLLDALRDRLDLHGTKKGCNQGACRPARSGSTGGGCWPASRSPSAARTVR